MSMTFRTISLAAALAASLVALGASTGAYAVERKCSRSASFDSHGLTSKWTCLGGEHRVVSPYDHYPGEKGRSAVGKHFDGSPATLAKKRDRTGTPVPIVQGAACDPRKGRCNF